MLWHPYASAAGTIGLRAEQVETAITIGQVFRPFGDFITETPWSLTRTDELRCTVTGYAHGDNGLSTFLSQAAADFRGWAGKREWCALENVDLVATNLGRGHVEFLLTLRHTADPDTPWSFSRSKWRRARAWSDSRRW